MPIFEGQPQTIIYDPTTGIITDANGNVISGVASYTWAQFTDAGFDTSIARYVHVSDRHSTTDGTSTPGSLWRIDPTAASARKRNLMSGPIYFATLAAAPDPASWPTLEIFAANIGINGSRMVSNGTVYRPKDPYITLINNLTLIQNSTNVNIEWQPAPVRLYRDINNKSIMRNGDYLVIHNAWAEKTGTTTDQLNVNVRFGTSDNITTDVSLLASPATSAAANYVRIIRFMEIVRNSNSVAGAKIRVRGPQLTSFNTGPLALAAAPEITAPDMDSTADSYLNIGIYLSGTTEAPVGLREYEVRLVRGA